MKLTAENMRPESARAGIPKAEKAARSRSAVEKSLQEEVQAEPVSAAART